MMAPLPLETHIEDIEALALLGALEPVHPLALVIDQGMRILWMSQACQALHESSEGHSGKSLGAFFAGLSGTCSPAFIDGQLARITSRLETQEAPTETTVDLGTRASLPYEFSVKFVRISSPEKPGIYFCILASSDSVASTPNDHPSATLEFFPEAAFIVAHDGSFFRVNKAACSLFQVEGRDLKGPAANFLMPYSSEMAKWLKDLPETGDTREQEFRFTQPDGKVKLMSLSSRRVEAKGEDRAKYLIWAQDAGPHLTRTRELELENARLGNFVHSIAHDLRSPLSSMLGFTQLLRRDYDQILDEPGRRFTHRIEQSTRRMKSLIDDLFELARIDFQPGNRTLIDSQSILYEIKEELADKLSEQGVELKIPEFSSPVLSSRSYLYQIFSNLVINSLEHMGECSRREIEVTIDDKPNHQMISVRDYGQGLPSEISEKAFEAFCSRFSGVEGERGRGLGLTIVKEVAEAHGGRAWVDSDPTPGFCIRVVLPTH